MAKGTRGGKRGASSLSENARVDKFLNDTPFDANGYKSIEMKNGAIIEALATQKDVANHLRDTNFDNIKNYEAFGDENTAIYIKYKNGGEAFLGYNSEFVDGNNKPIAKVKTTGIKTYIESNGNTQVMFGDAKIVNYKDLYANWGEDDWRVEEK